MNLDSLALFFSSFPPEFATFILAMIPVLELQASIPIALGAYKLPLVSAYFFSIAGNLVPAFFLLMFLDPVSKHLMERSSFFKKIFEWVFQYTRGKFSQKYIKYGQWAIFAFIAIPTPLSGAWSSSVAAFLFNIPFKRAFLLIALGELIAGAIIIGIARGALVMIRPL